MGAVAVDRHIHDSIIDNAPPEQIELFHGYTTGGSPVAAAAAVAALQIYESEQLLQRGERAAKYFLDQVFSLREFPVVTDIRGYGLIAGLDFRPDGEPGRRGYRLQKILFDAGLHVKTTGDAAIIAPPLVAEPWHVDEAMALLRKVLAAEK